MFKNAILKGIRMTTRPSLGQRMKTYERVSNFRLTPRIPLICRIDGVAFHTLAKKLKLIRPFDSTFADMMSLAARTLAGKVQGAVIAYTQSDEISLLIRTDQSEQTTPWFDNRLQKMSSVIASIVSGVFNRELHLSYSCEIGDLPIAAFDCRIYEVPDLTEAVNYFIWRQNDCTKNSISSAAYFELAKVKGRKTAQKMLHGLNQNERQELLWKECHINWNNYSDMFKRGVMITRQERIVETPNGTASRKTWATEIPPRLSSEMGKAWIFRIVDPPVDQEEQVGGIYECADCLQEWKADELNEPKDILDRLLPGDIFPDGECPDCGALCFGKH